MGKFSTLFSWKEHFEGMAELHREQNESLALQEKQSAAFRLAATSITHGVCASP